jgi:DNA topoisomerase-1
LAERATKRKASNGNNLVIVESPAKARTISRILGDDYEVKASVGHVRDLPSWGLGVDTETFEPRYEVTKDKKKVVKEIESAAKKAGTVYLATDPDREGEAIAWHLVEAANLDAKPLRRVIFHEITQGAVREAFDHPREVDMKLVDAQQARRVVDRLVGYPLSWFLARKVRKGLSAGRVQSVAVRLVVEREREIRAFVPVEYWTMEARLGKEGAPPIFSAKLAGYAGSREKLEIPGQDTADRIAGHLRESAFVVAKIDTKKQSRRPAPPFITSTLQQEASRRLGFTTKRAMAAAQKLYEGVDIGDGGQVGLITYMRTDSTNVAESAQAEARAFIARKYGDRFVPVSPRTYAGKVKGAQEAHEAIRPTSVERDPESVRRYLKQDEYRLYTLVWQRFVASQMADAEFDVTTAEITASPPAADAYLLRATNTQLRFAGFRQVYIEGRDEGDEEEDVGTNPLPALAQGDALRLNDLIPEQHFTEPPPRYTEASLIKALEEKGIGRPSTYAPTMTTIQERDYVNRDGKALRPTELGETVNDLLVEYFPVFIDSNFTAGMEQDLDEIAAGEKEWQPVVRDFYGPLQEALETAKEEAPKQVEETGEMCPESGHPLVVRWGRRGQFIACSGYPECKYSKPMPGEEPEEELPKVEEACPDCGKPLAARHGRNGPFIGCTGYPKCRYTRPIEGEEDPLPKIEEPCPDCGKPLSARKSRWGNPFIGCTAYPKCKYTRPMPTGVKCPRDGGDLEEKRARGKRGSFYGCSNYPECDFTVPNRPLQQPCPSCASLITLERDGSAKCTSCEWKGDVPAKREPVAVG